MSRSYEFLVSERHHRDQHNTWTTERARHRVEIAEAEASRSARVAEQVRQRAEAQAQPHLLLTPSTDLPDRGGTSLKKTIDPEQLALAPRLEAELGRLCTPRHTPCALDPLLHLAVLDTMQNQLGLPPAQLWVQIDPYSIKVYPKPPLTLHRIWPTGSTPGPLPNALSQGIWLRGTLWTIELINECLPQTLMAKIEATVPPWEDGILQYEAFSFRMRGRLSSRQ
jgi:hypothetical protein